MPVGVPVRLHIMAVPGGVGPGGGGGDDDGATPRPGERCRPGKGARATERVTPHPAAHRAAHWLGSGSTRASRRYGTLAPGVPLVYGGDGATERRSTLAGAVRRIYTQAGLDREADVTTESVRAWLGRAMRDQGEPIERVARRLGMRSVDRTFLLIGEDWQSPEA